MLRQRHKHVIAGDSGDHDGQQALVVVASVVERKWRENSERDSEEEVALAAVQEEVMSESEEKSHSAKRGTA